MRIMDYIFLTLSKLVPISVETGYIGCCKDDENITPLQMCKSVQTCIKYRLSEY